MFCWLPARRSTKGTAATKRVAESREVLSHLAGPQQGSGSVWSLQEDGELWGMEGSTQTLSLEAN